MRCVLLIAVFIWNALDCYIHLEYISLLFICNMYDFEIYLEGVCLLFIWNVYAFLTYLGCVWLLIDWLVFNANVSSISAISWLVIVEIRSSSYNIAYNNLTNKMKICKCKEILHVGCRNKMKKAPHFTSFAQGLLSKVAGIN